MDYFNYRGGGRHFRALIDLDIWNSFDSTQELTFTENL